MALPVPEPSKTLSKSIGRSFPKNPLSLTPRQQQIHQQTIKRHLSNKKLPIPPLSPLVIPPTAPINVITSSNIKIQNKNRSNFVKSKSKSDRNVLYESSHPSLATSHSVVGDLPDFKERETSKSSKKGIRHNKSAPSLSTLQQEKLEKQQYMHPSQIPRSLSATFADYKPNTTITMLMDLPYEAFIGIGGGIRKNLSAALMALKIQEEYDAKHDDDEDSDDDNLLLREQSQKGIPAAPNLIPPTEGNGVDINNENDLSVVKIHIDDQQQQQHDKQLPDAILPAPPSPQMDDEQQQIEQLLSHKKRTSSRDDIRKKKKSARISHAESVKHDIEQALQQGYTRNLMIAIFQGIIGAFLYGWNISMLNVPQDNIEDATGLSDTAYAALQSAFCGGGLVGALSGGIVADMIGRKTAFIVLDIFFLASAFIGFFYADGVFGDADNSSNYVWFYLSRAVSGIAAGGATAVVPTYLGEISPAVIRGAVGTLNQLTICFGIVIVEVLSYGDLLGSKDSYKWLFMGNALTIIQLLTLFSFPESPKWLIQKNKDDKAKKALQYLRQTEDVRFDMILMKGGVLHEDATFHSPHVSPKYKQRRNPAVNPAGNSINRPGGGGISSEPLLDDDNNRSDHKIPTLKSPGSSTFKSGMDPGLKKAVKWALIIAIVLMCMQQFSGINAVFYYSATILKKAGLKSDLQQWLGSLSISIANFFAVFIAVATIDKAGRKKLLILSLTGMIIASVVISIALIFVNDGDFWHYLSIGSLIFFVVAFETGLGAIPWVMMAEVSPIQKRGMIVSVATFANWLTNLFIAQFSGAIIDATYFFPFAATCAAGVLFTIKYIPETNGKTAQQIQKELQNM